MGILLVAGGGRADPEPDADAAADPEAAADPQLMRPPAYEPGCGMMDSCCGMSDEGCCVGGQQCYTYYENICENVNVANCNMRGRKVCEQIELQDCRVVRERSSLVSQKVNSPYKNCFQIYVKFVCLKKA